MSSMLHILIDCVQCSRAAMYYTLCWTLPHRECYDSIVSFSCTKRGLQIRHDALSPITFSIYLMSLHAYFAPIGSMYNCLVSRPLYKACAAPNSLIFLSFSVCRSVPRTQQYESHGVGASHTGNPHVTETASLRNLLETLKISPRTCMGSGVNGFLLKC